MTFLHIQYLGFLEGMFVIAFDYGSTNSAWVEEYSEQSEALNAFSEALESPMTVNRT